jgi:hypothetical protein
MLINNSSSVGHQFHTRFGLRIGSKSRTPAEFFIRQDENDLESRCPSSASSPGFWRFRCNRTLVARSPDRGGSLEWAAGQVQGRRRLRHPARLRATGRNQRTQTACVWQKPLGTGTVELRLRTKSLRSSPLRGGASREAGSRWRGQR